MKASNPFSTIFVHIPKTAGTTLRSIIESQFADNQLCAIYQGNAIYLEMSEFKNLSEDAKRNYQIFCGHFNFGIHSEIPQPTKYITILRDPVERIISLYHHHLKDVRFQTDKNSGPLRRQLQTGNLSLADFVSSGISLQADNCQTRFLSGEGPEFGQCTYAMLAKAKKNLRTHFTVAGLTERFDESLLLIQKALNWQQPYYVKQNISAAHANKEELDEPTLDAIRQYNSLDIELYDFVQELLNEQIENQGEDFQKALAEFKIANRKFAEKYNKWILFYKLTSNTKNLYKLIKLRFKFKH